MNEKRFKKCQDVYLYIQNRYYYYDSQEGRYCGEKYTKQVFEDACDYFNLPLDKIEELYGEYGLMSNKTSNLYKVISKFKENPELLKVTKLNNKKVKLNVDKIIKDKARSNPKFIDFIKNNRNTVFTAETDSKMNTMYCLKENKLWLFHESDLIEVD